MASSEPNALERLGGRPLRVFIGWDSREIVAGEVAAFSMGRRTTIPLDIMPLRVQEMRSRGLYWRENDPLASTEFTYTRFLTPALAGHQGFALFCDCDFLWLADIADLLREVTGDKAVWCVKHDYRPTETTKMVDAVQTVYPRKNWSSLMLFDCSHPAVAQLTPEVVNRETGRYLHGMAWAGDDEIGELPVFWNWLEGWNARPPVGTPNAVHFTRGGPWFEKWRNTEYSDLWRDERLSMERASSEGAASRKASL